MLEAFGEAKVYVSETPMKSDWRSDLVVEERRDKQQMRYQSR
jgi:hypothetical protein